MSLAGKTLFITGGSRGIIIYRNSQDEFTALDRHANWGSLRQTAANSSSE